MKNSQEKYPHIEFNRKLVSKRIKETKDILKNLRLLAKHPDKEHRLYIDDETGEYWQLAYAWNWGSERYCFLVPDINIDEWEKERYVDPDELLIYAAMMSDYLSVPSNRKIKNLDKHVRSLQKVGSLPENPEGRWFGPYIRENIIPNLEQLNSQDSLQSP